MLNATQLADDYLIARVENLYFGVFCRDVKRVYNQSVKIVPICRDSDIFRGIAHINSETLNLIDLRRRIGLQPNAEIGHHTLIGMQTSMQNKYAVLVDEIIGLRSIKQGQMIQSKSEFNNKSRNVHLLFPQIATMDDRKMIHLLDSTYLDKTESVNEESCGALEMF
jgi:chemotaxis signal transduction protein